LWFDIPDLRNPQTYLFRRGRHDAEMFNLLTGGARFDRKRDGGAIDAFKSTDPKPSEEEAPVDTGASGASSSAGGRKRKRKGAEPVAEEPSESQLQHTQEQQQSYRHRRGIHVSGDDVPAPAPSFASLSACAVLDRPTALPASAAARLKLNISTVGFIDPTPIQAQALPVLLEGRDLLAGAPTGSGKTAAFVLPIIAGLMLEAGVGGSSHHHTHHVPGSCTAAVIVAPTLELAGQIHRQVQKFLRKLPLTSQLVDTVASSSDVAAASDSGILADGQSSGGTVKAADIVVGTPISLLGAFQDSSSKNSRVFLNLPSKPEAGDGAAASAKTTKKGKKKSISSKPAASTSAGVRYLVLDEADRLFDLGFVTQVRYICRERERHADTACHTHSCSLLSPVSPLFI
jgi:superfamily II DNA/RNA helicase